MPLKFVSLNVKGLNSPAKRASLMQEEKSLRADILFVQESDLAKGKCPRLHFPHFPHLYLANAHKKACGVFIAIHDSISFRHIHTIEDPLGRCIVLICKLNGTLFTLVNLYAPNTKQRKFLTHLFHSLVDGKARLLQGEIITLLYTLPWILPPKLEDRHALYPPCYRNMNYLTYGMAWFPWV